MAVYFEPKNFKELIGMVSDMEFGDWAESEDRTRFIQIGNMIGGKYELYADHEFVGCESDPAVAAHFIAKDWFAKGWEHHESAEERTRRRIKEDREESIKNGWIYP